jgi:Fibronectin type III domain
MGVRRFVRRAGCVVMAVAIPLVVAAPAAGGRPRPPAIDRTPPTQPTNLRVTDVTQTSVSLAWSPSTDNVGVIGYSVEIDGRDGVIFAWDGETTLTWSFLKPGETVTFRVTAFDGRWNESPPSAPVTVTLLPPSPPSGPSGLTVESVTASKVLLRWNSGHDPNGLVTHDVLVNGAPTTDAWSTLPPGSFPRPPILGAWVRQLEPSTTYQFTVRAFDSSGDLLGSTSTVSATTEASPTGDTIAPTTPTLLRASDGGTSWCPEEIELRWTRSTDDVSGPNGIEYEVRINGRINDVLPYFSDVVIYTEVRGANTVTIVAVDEAGNASAASNARTVNIQWGGGCDGL